MSLFKLHFEVFGEVQLSRVFEGMIEDVEDLTEPFNEIAEEYYQSMVRVFEREGAFEERQRWQDLSPAYARWKAENFPGRKILELTGRMKRAATIRGARENITEIRPKEMTLGLSTPYAVKHQKGLEGLPKRTIIELTSEQKKRWVHIIHTYLYYLRQSRTKRVYRQKRDVF